MLTAKHFAHLDIPTEVERHTGTKLRPHSRSGRQWVGACPYQDCSVDDNGFMVWPDLTDRGRHYYCRGCRRAGDLVQLLRDIRGYSFHQACEVLEIISPYHGNGIPVPALPRVPRQPPVPGKDCLVLRAIYPRARLALKHPRASAYLAARGIPFDLADELGVAYIPPFDAAESEEQRAIAAWTDRLIFPLSSPAGQGFTGRSLLYWTPGMDEYEHKQLLDEYKVPRYKTTYPAGYFHAEVLLECEHVTFVEGPADACALLAGGIYDALATCGTSLDPAVIPVRICDATLAYDGDEEGRRAARDVRRVLRRAGISTSIITPPADDMGKDWSERYRLHGAAGLALLLLRQQEQSQAEVSLPESEASAEAPTACSVCGCVPVWDQGYCLAHWQERESASEQVPFTSAEHFEGVVATIAASLRASTGATWVVEIVPKNYTLDRHIRVLEEQERKRTQYQRVTRGVSAAQRRARIPAWLLPGTSDYTRLLEHLRRNNPPGFDAEDEVASRRTAWEAEMKQRTS